MKTDCETDGTLHSTTIYDQTGLGWCIYLVRASARMSSRCLKITILSSARVHLALLWFSSPSSCLAIWLAATIWSNSLINGEVFARSEQLVIIQTHTAQQYIQAGFLSNTKFVPCGKMGASVFYIEIHRIYCLWMYVRVCVMLWHVLQSQAPF